LQSTKTAIFWTAFMPTLLSSISKHLRRAYEKAEEFIEEEREIPVSQVFLNATFKRYVTDNLSFWMIYMPMSTRVGYVCMPVYILKD
jgi:hypothetical protein